MEEVQFSVEVEEPILAETNVTELVEAQVVLLGDALEIVNQVAEEYNQSLANNNQSLTNDGWIPVSSGNLPKEGQVVNATILIESQQRRFVTQVMYGSWWLNSDKRMIAWKPLEEPYEGE